MKFCGTCNNMFYIAINEEDPNKLSYYCRHCGERDAHAFDEGVCILNTTLQESQGSNLQARITPYTKLDPTLPRVRNIPCPNQECPTHHPKAPGDVLYLRYDDQKLYYLYMCCVCDTVWKSR
jgi:DNA-directed RNA polymerase subunit M/transcription elongation factor TFIIS